MANAESQIKYAIVGAGFTGLSAAYDLTREGHSVTLYERDASLGGLAATFDIGGQELEKFYHHWLGTDVITFNFIRELGYGHKLLFKESKVGIYHTNKIFRFSSPTDLLRFTPLPFFARLRFGLSVLYAWTIKDMSVVENISAEEWLLKVAGKDGYETVWKPLLIGKFGEDYYKDVAAVWLWNKLIQRGKSRDGTAKEKLAYYSGGFSGFINDLYAKVSEQGGTAVLNTDVKSIIPEVDGRIKLGLVSNGLGGETGEHVFDRVIYTGHTPEFSPLVRASGYNSYADELDRIKYLANVCLILESKKSLSDIYWLNVNDPGFPFVGIIEHTNFEEKDNYCGNHLIYLSKYIPTTDKLYAMTPDEMYAFALPHIQRMFPDFDPDNIIKHYLWRAEYAQPMITTNYRSIIPSYTTPLKNVYLCTMAQVYPEDRGTNYAIHHGRKLAQELLERDKKVA